MSKNNALEAAVASHMAGDANLPAITHWRLQPIIGAADPGTANLEADSFTVPSYSGYAALAVANSEIYATGSQIKLNVRKTFAKVAGAGIKVRRFVLEMSTDGGSTWPYKYYSDSDLNTDVAVDVEPYAEAETGFVISED